MRAYFLRIILLVVLLAYYFASVSILSHDLIYAENFENKNLPVKLWAKNADVKVHYLGLSDEKTLNGKKTLKVDVTILGNGEKDCFYYWIIPIRAKLYGDVNYKADIWTDSLTSKFVSLGFSFIYPPDPAQSNPVVREFNKWYSLKGSVPADNLANAAETGTGKMLYSSYREGRMPDRFGIFIRGKGEHRLTFYLGQLELKGRTFNLSDLGKYLKKQWQNYFSRYSFVSNDNNSIAGNLPEIPDTRRIRLSPSGQRLLSELYQDRVEILEYFKEFENDKGLNEENFGHMNSLVSSFPAKIEALNAELNAPEAKASFFTFPATKFNQLTGMNLPENISQLRKLSARGCPGEYMSFTFLLQPRSPLRNVTMKWSDFTGEGKKFDARALDVSIAKVWYQAGIKSSDTQHKHLTQELLVKNDSLVMVDYGEETNYLLVKNETGRKRYIDISSPAAEFPENITVEDSNTLLPFNLDGATNRQIWLTVHIPENAKAGKYQSRFTVTSREGRLIEFPVEIEVLPFKLDEPRLTYSLYYHGALRDWKLRPFHCEDKTAEQLRIELNDMKEHGVLYPNNYQDIKHLGENLSIRNQAGLPNDRLYSTLLDWFKGPPKTPAELDQLKQRILKFRSEAEKYGYKDLYIYGIDEARGKTLTDQRPGWQAAHEAGAKIFVAGYYETFSDMGDLLDLAIIQGPLSNEQAKLYHSAGNRIFSYSNPQVGQENPEIYRRNFGLALWKAGYDGCMNYAYQKNYKNFWNDFDNPRYREETFTYPLSNGLLSTIQWEGFRQGINDVRYLSTLLNKIDSLRSRGKNADELQNWVNSIDASRDLDQLRGEIIDKILTIMPL